jgi:two-component system sensor histidine kinase VicK
MADREAVIRILLNLLSNAEKYSDGTREITMTVTREVDSGNVNVSVSDRGIGVPRSHRARIFREFHRVDSSLTSGRGGTGLGLSIARSLARAMGGDVLYRPRDRVDGLEGSVFTLVLPSLPRKEGS